MRDFLLKTAINGVALWLAALVVPGLRLGEDAPELSVRLLTIVLVALVFGVVNAILKPVFSFFGFPLVVLTLGLFTIVINALMLVITAGLSGWLGLDFYVDSFFWSAVLGALVVSFVSLLLNTLLRDEARRRVR